MAICISCGKHPVSRSWSRHKKGSSGATKWPLRAQITKKLQSPNLHTFKGQKYCTKCLRLAKEHYKITHPALIVNAAGGGTAPKAPLVIPKPTAAA